ncbi:MAG: ankyrin repeat domain-containing protein [Acidobacteria bacterium]|nr:ankyrin repeat domain-containing protein [Acidobacteriota bacterium]
MWKRLLIVPLALLLLWACGSSSEDHRRALEELGVVWDEEAFLAHAKQGDQAVLELFLSGGMDLEVRDSTGGTALMYAALNGHVAATSLLIGQGADLNAEDDLGRRALDYASVHPASGAFQLLAAAGAIYGTFSQ